MTRKVDIKIKALEAGRQREIRAAARARQEGKTVAMEGHLRQADQLLDAINAERATTEMPVACF